MERSHIPLGDLVARCREETERYARREATRDEFCLELFRRAICDRAAMAWEAVFAQYAPLVRTWVRTHPAAATTREDDEYWMNRTFERFWGAIPPERFAAFTHIAALLQYLKLCAHSVLLDELRARHSVRIEPLTDAGAEHAVTPDVAIAAVDAMEAQHLWEAIRAEARGMAEERIAYLCFVLGLKPREIHEQYPDQFPVVDDIYRIKRNLLERLKRSATIREFL